MRLCFMWPIGYQKEKPQVRGTLFLAAGSCSPSGYSRGSGGFCCQGCWSGRFGDMENSHFSWHGPVIIWILLRPGYVRYLSENAASSAIQNRDSIRYLGHTTIHELWDAEIW